MIGREISVLIPADRPDELSNLRSRVLAGETVRNFRTERVRKDGTLVAVSITVSPVVDPDGTVLGVSTIAHDLTFHDQQMADLREAHRLADETLSTLETLHGSAPVGLGFVDRDFRVIHVNEMLAAVNGSTVEEQIGKTVAESVPELWPQIEPAFRHVVEHDESVLNIEASGEMAADPGRERYWLASYYPVHVDGEVIGVGIVAVDVTERRQAEDFRSIVMNNMAEGLFTVDAQGRLTSMNDCRNRGVGLDRKRAAGHRDARRTARPGEWRRIDRRRKPKAPVGTGRTSPCPPGGSRVPLQERFGAPGGHLCLAASQRYVGGRRRDRLPGHQRGEIRTASGQA